MATARTRLAARSPRPTGLRASRTRWCGAGQGYPEAVGQGVGKPKRQAKGLTSDALAAVKATVPMQRVHKGKPQRKETGAQPLCVPCGPGAPAGDAGRPAPALR